MFVWRKALNDQILIHATAAIHSAASLGRILRWAAGCWLMLAAGRASAQAFDNMRLFVAAPGQDAGRAGLALSHGSRYDGFDQTRTILVPSIDYRHPQALGSGGDWANSTNYSCLSSRSPCAFNRRAQAPPEQH